MKKPARSPLSLKLETIRRLDQRQLGSVAGGLRPTPGETTIPSWPPTACVACPGGLA
jgi:hypothetical protein